MRTRAGLALALVLGWITLHGCADMTRPPVQVVASRPAAVDRPAAGVIRLRRVGDHLFVPVAVNGHESGYFLFDTGAATSGIGLGLAEFLDLPARGGGEAIGIGGREAFDLYHPREVVVGGVAVAPAPLAGLDFSGFSRASGASVSGLIGFPAVAGHVFTLDQGRQTITIHDPSAPAPAGHVAPLRRVHTLPAIDARLEGGGVVRLIIDTGMDNELTLPTDVLHRWPGIAAAPVATRGRSTGVGGAIDSFSSWLRGVRVLGVDLGKVPVNFETPPEGMGQQNPPVGRIGNRLLRHFVLTFDAPRNRIHARWRPLDP